MTRRSTGEWIGIVSLFLAAVAFIPSTAAFTPAIFLALTGFVGATIAALLGSLRLAAITFFIVCATFIVTSQSFASLARVEYLMVAFATVAVVFGVALYGQHKSKRWKPAKSLKNAPIEAGRSGPPPNPEARPRESVAQWFAPGLLPEEIAAKSISPMEIVLPQKEALLAIDLLESQGVLILGWEGWIRDSSGRVGHGSAPQGAVSPNQFSVSEAADLCRKTIRQAATAWAETHHQTDQELHFCLTVRTT